MKRIIVAVSGGPDSMALLHKLKDDKCEIIVAHVNYKMRDTADRDQKIVEDFCNKYDIKLEVLERTQEVTGNFQAFARKFRYEFMLKLAKKYDVNKIYVAHHLDDVLETYLMQKERGITPSYYGISKTSVYKDIIIQRPYLDFTKEELEYYCKTNDIEYGIDESNETDVYERNRIRNNELKNMCIREKKDMIKEIALLNEELAERKERTVSNLQRFLQDNSIDTLMELDDSDAIDVLREWFTQYEIYNISNDEFDSLLDFIKSNKNGDYELTKEYILHKSYGNLVVVIDDDEEFSYTIDRIEDFDCPHFKVRLEGTPEEGVTVSKDDFPLTIRNYKRGDKIQMKYGTKNVSRFFIDRKIPSYERKNWPVVLNAAKEVILVPRLGCNVTHFSNNPTLFVVK